MKKPVQLINSIYNRLYYYCAPDKIYLNKKFKEVFNRKINWKNPITYNEKLQWLKIYDRNPIYSTLVDKYEVRKYIEDLIGKEYLIPCFGVWNNFDDIDFSLLPNQFVLKCTHDSGSVIICHDKSLFDLNNAKKILTSKLKRNFYYNAREWPYKNIKPRIIAEKYMKDEETHDLKDYKFFCFNGEVKCFKIDFDRFSNHHANYYDCKGNLLAFGEKNCPPDYNQKLEIPKNINEMLFLAKKLSKGIPFARIDFYSIYGKIYFGEITFFPAAGLGKFIPDEWDQKLGEWLNLRK